MAAALGHALPNLVEALAQAEVTDKAEVASTFAVARAAGRPVPFGLLGTWTLAATGSRTELSLHGRDGLDLLVRPSLAASEPPGDPWVVSPFLHAAGGSWRLIDGSRTTSVTPDPFVRAVLTHLDTTGSATRGELTQVVVGLGAGPTGAAAYVEQLIGSGLLVPRPVLSPVAVVPPEPRRWRSTDRPDPGLSVDTLRGGSVALGPELVRELERGLELLRRVTPPVPPPPLAHFATAFARRFGDDAVPLLVALDPERGVALRPVGAPTSLALPSAVAAARRTWGPRDDLLHALVGRAEDGEVRLTHADVTALEGPPTELPTAGTALVSLGPDSTVWWRGFFGPGSAAPFARLAAGWPELADELRGHVARADRLAPGPVLELIDVPDDRLVDVVPRPDLGRRELLVRGLAGDHGRPALTPRDLHVRVDDGRVVLLGPDRRPVQVRHSTLWNTELASDVVHLLALAGDPLGHGTRAWSWGALEATAGWTPRVRHGRSVLAPQTWRVTPAVLTRLRADGDLDGVRDRLGLPRLVSMGEPGTSLVMDLDEPTQARAAHVLLARGGTRLIREVPPSPVTSPEGHHLHDLLVGIVDPRPRVTHPVRTTKPTTHTPGSGWVSTTWEASPAGIDRLLREHVPALVEEAAAAQWFFLRFADPHHHLRLRFRGDVRTLLPLVHAAHARASGLTRLLTVDTYVPEVDRYTDLAKAEAAFHADSRAVLSLLPSLPPTDRWRIALVGGRRLLDALAVPVLDDWSRRSAVEGSHLSAGRALRAERELLLAGLEDPDVIAPGATEALGRRDEQLRALGIDDPETAVSLAHLHVNRVLVDRHREHEAVISDLLVRLARIPRPGGAAPNG